MPTQQREYQYLGPAEPDAIRALWHEGCEFAFGFHEGQPCLHVYQVEQQVNTWGEPDKTPGRVKGRSLVRKYRTFGYMPYQSREAVLTFFYTCGKEVVSDFGWQWVWEAQHPFL